MKRWEQIETKEKQKKNSNDEEMTKFILYNNEIYNSQ